VNTKPELTKLEALLREGRYIEASILFETASVSVTEYQPITAKYPRDTSRPNIIMALVEFDFELADDLATSITDSDIRRRYDELRATFDEEQQRKTSRRAFIARMKDAFTSDFLNADAIYRADPDAGLIDGQRYRKLKA
jgi:hypothetical protein